MELLTVLEKRVSALLSKMNDLIAANSKLESGNKELQSQNSQLQQEIARLTAHIATLEHEAEALKSVVLKESSHLEEISQERAQAKLLLEDLIKNIESCTPIEKQ